MCVLVCECVYQCISAFVLIGILCVCSNIFVGVCLIMWFCVMSVYPLFLFLGGFLCVFVFVYI